MSEQFNYDHDLVFTSAIERVRNPVELSQEYIDYLTGLVLVGNEGKSISWDEVYECLCLFYPNTILKKVAYVKSAKLAFPDFTVAGTEKQLLLKSMDLTASVSRYGNKTLQEIYDILLNKLMDKTVDDTVKQLIYALDYNRTNNPVYYYGFLDMYISKKFEQHVKWLNDNVKLIQKENYNIEIESIIENSTVKRILSYYGCSTIEDLVSMNVDDLVNLTILDIEDIYKIVDICKQKPRDFFNELIDGTFANLNDREKEVIALRNGFATGITQTLEEVAVVFEVTRERIRQIEAKGERKLQSLIEENSKKFALVFNILKGDRPYVLIDELNEYFQDKEITGKYLYLIGKCENIPLVYYPNYSILLNESLCTIENLKDEMLEGYTSFITQKQYDDSSELFKKFVSENYNIKKGVYVRKGENSFVLLDHIIQEQLPDGYHNGSQEDFMKIYKAGKELYGDEFDLSSEHAVMAILDHHNYILVDRGTYKNKELCVNLSVELLADILDFISSNMPVVFYNAIYENFKDRLNEAGVTNSYYLKGLLDSDLPEEFHTQRDYITGKKGMSNHDIILQYLNSFEGVFNMSTVRKKFPTTAEYIFANVLYRNQQFLNLYGGNYINVERLNLSEDSIQSLKNVVNKVLDLSDEGFVSDRKIYARLKLFNKSLMQKIPAIDNHFALYTLIQYLFGSEYYFSRPFLSRNADIELNADALIMDHVRKFDSFTQQTVLDYTSRINMRGLYSYLIFMENMSDEYVQVAIDKMVKKEVMNLSDADINEIRKIVTMMVEHAGEIHTSTFKGYGMLPKIKYSWNKYLLVGIIRSYLDEFSIENTENMYSTTEFIIKKSEDKEVPSPQMIWN